MFCFGLKSIERFIDTNVSYLQKGESPEFLKERVIDVFSLMEVKKCVIEISHFLQMFPQKLNTYNIYVFSFCGNICKKY